MQANYKSTELLMQQLTEQTKEKIKIALMRWEEGGRDRKLYADLMHDWEIIITNISDHFYSMVENLPEESSEVLDYGVTENEREALYEHIDVYIDMLYDALGFIG
jgi:glycerophosphoryl diester phosphodiesterase